MPDAYRILITGSREWDDYGTVCMELGGIMRHLMATVRPCPRIVVVHGAAGGADALADQAARAFGMTPEPHPADWQQFGKGAGFRRNADMVALGASVALAFIAPCIAPACRDKEPHGSHGASHCADLAERAGIPTRRFEP